MKQNRFIRIIYNIKDTMVITKCFDKTERFLLPYS